MILTNKDENIFENNAKNIRHGDKLGRKSTMGCLLH